MRKSLNLSQVCQIMQDSRYGSPGGEYVDAVRTATSFRLASPTKIWNSQAQVEQQTPLCNCCLFLTSLLPLHVEGRYKKRERL